MGGVAPKRDVKPTKSEQELQPPPPQQQQQQQQQWSSRANLNDNSYGSLQTSPAARPWPQAGGYGVLPSGPPSDYQTSPAARPFTQAGGYGSLPLPPSSDRRWEQPGQYQAMPNFNDYPGLLLFVRSSLFLT